jgi:GrpB-like predicted nucleotidyltransferase (UPF0157 family)
MAKPDPIVIVAYDPRWPQQFEELRARIQTALGELAIAIHHVGSTAVPGLAAKPIIDLDVVIASRAMLPAAIAALAALGYSHQGDLGIPGREAFRSTHAVRHNLYVCADGAEPLRKHLAFRDQLRAHPDAAAAYAALKKGLAERHRDNRDAYTDGKTELVRKILALTVT